MQEITPPEGPKRTELITPDSIKSRVMMFFKDVDLSRIGVIESGDGLIKVASFDFPSKPAIGHFAAVNGFQVAQYEHTIPDALLEPLAAGKDRQVARYCLNGNNGIGDVSVELKEYQGKPPEIILTIPGDETNSYSQRGPIQEFDDSWKFKIAGLLGIT